MDIGLVVRIDPQKIARSYCEENNKQDKPRDNASNPPSVASPRMVLHWLIPRVVYGIVDHVISVHSENVDIVGQA